MTEQLELNILRKQNCELACKIQSYRRQNRVLEAKNEELEAWTANFAAVISSLQAAMRVFTTNEEGLYALMKRSDVKEKTCLSKYTHHFKTFNDILANLCDRLRDPERSSQHTTQIRQRIELHVKAYEVFFKEFIAEYFRFNDENSRWVSSTLQNPDLPDIFRKIGKKELEHRAKLRQVQQFMDEQRGIFTKYAVQNQSMLLGELFRKEQQEVRRLTELNYNMTRKFRLVMDYNRESVQRTLAEGDQFVECVCGGTQLAYFKREWEERQRRQSQPQQTNGTATNIVVADTEQFMLLQTEIQELRRNNTSYLERYERTKIEKNIEEAVIKSHAFKDLINQCQELLRYCSSLQEKLKQSNDKIVEIQRSRERELRELKKRYDLERLATTPLNVQNINPKIIGKQIQDFKNDMSRIINPVRELLERSGLAEDRSLEIAKSMQANMENLRRDNDELRRRVQELELDHRPPETEFKHEAHKKLMRDIEHLLQKQDSKFIEGFKDFVKSREKKATYLQTELKKKEKELTSKGTFLESLKKSLSETEYLYKQNKQKMEKLGQSLTLLKDDIEKLVEENLEIKTEFDNEKTILNLRLKSQAEVNLKLEEKIAGLQALAQENQASRMVYAEYQINQQTAYLSEMKNKHEALELEQRNLLDECNLAKAKLLEYEKTEKRYIQDNQHLRTKLNSIRKAQIKKEQVATKITQLTNNQQDTEMMRIELENLRSKLYCSCKNDREIEVSLRTCPHMFCKKCIDDVTSNRARFCPLCKTKFSKSDINLIKWN